MVRHVPRKILCLVEIAHLHTEKKALYHAFWTKQQLHEARLLVCITFGKALLSSPKIQVSLEHISNKIAH